MYSLIDYSCSTLLFLPVEMLVNILRFLDDKSLLNAAFSSKRFMSVCKRDPLLRRRIRSYIRTEKQLFKKSTLNAKLQVEIIRHDQPQLFVEMLVNILRFLDDKSLLNTAFSSKRFMNVCKGDPVLRRRIRSYIRKEKQLFKKSTLNAKLQVEIIRHDQPQLFGKNQKKTVTLRKLDLSRFRSTTEPTARHFIMSELDNRPSGGEKLRSKCKDRLAPYKVIRF
ncbi:hypothetical protein RN001_009725 [Aquatica leii]|uniref:F-box domain-containing protein n=1 Tax=Aquatica leii TaxID=1421715 RepID=A0AAN7PU17_9COLE|nr:hypothetical protein RN001_009725 [Aquatica leii]